MTSQTTDKSVKCPGCGERIPEGAVKSPGWYERVIRTARGEGIPDGRLDPQVSRLLMELIDLREEHLANSNWLQARQLTAAVARLAAHFAEEQAS